VDKFKDLTRLMTGARPAGPPEDFSSRVMNRIMSNPNAGRPARIGCDTATLRPFRPAYRQRLKHALSRLIGIPTSTGELAVAFLNIGVFFIVAGLVFILGMNFPFQGENLAAASYLFIFIGPAFAAGMGLVLTGWMIFKNPGRPGRFEAKLVFVQILFGLTAIFGIMLEKNPGVTLAAVCFGMSGLAATGFLVAGLRRICHQAFR